jgi:hypothetical protein
LRAYRNTREVCLKLVDGTDAATEFDTLFPLIEPIPMPHSMGRGDTIQMRAQGDQARLLLAQLAGWLGSWLSAEALLDELVRALEAAEVETDEPAARARLAGIREGLVGAGRQIAINVVSEYLKRVNVHV